MLALTMGQEQHGIRKRLERSSLLCMGVRELQESDSFYTGYDHMGEEQKAEAQRFYSSKNTEKQTTLVVAASTQNESRRDDSRTTAVTDGKPAEYLRFDRYSQCRKRHSRRSGFV
jgi:hypothetical protein